MVVTPTTLTITQLLSSTAEQYVTLDSGISRPFDNPKQGRIAVKVINHLGDEVMKQFRAS